MSSAQGSNKIANYTDAVTGAFSNSNTTRAGVSGNSAFSTGTAPYTIGSSVTFQVDAAVVSSTAPDNSNSINTFGGATTATVTHGSSYAGTASSTVGTPVGSGGSDARGAFLSGSSGPQYGGTATILAGLNSTADGGGSAAVSMAWRTRITSPTANQENRGGPGTAVPIDTSGLISDVVNLTGLTPGSEQSPFTTPQATDPYVLDMSYNNALIPKNGAADEAGAASRGHIYLVTLNGSVWENAVSANGAGPGVDAATNFQGSFTQFIAANTGNGKLFATTPTQSQIDSSLSSLLGSWGVDISTHQVWSVVDHNSEFAVVPEPATLLLAGLGLVGLIAVRRRKTA